MRSYAQNNPFFAPPAIQYVAAFGNPPARDYEYWEDFVDDVYANLPGSADDVAGLLGASVVNVSQALAESPARQGQDGVWYPEQRNPPRINSDERLRLLERRAASGDPEAEAALSGYVGRLGGATVASMSWEPGMRFEVEKDLGEGWPKAYQVQAGVWELTEVADAPHKSHVLQRVGRKGKLTKSARNMRTVDPSEFDQAIKLGLVKFTGATAAPAAAPRDPSTTSKAERRALSDALHRNLARTYFRSVGEGVNYAAAALESVGFELAGHFGAPFWNQDGNWRETVQIARKTSDPFSPQAIEDTWLHLAFHKMPESGNVEVTGYMTASNPRATEAHYPGQGMIQGTDRSSGEWQAPPGTPDTLSSKAFKAAMRKAKVTTRDVARASDLSAAQVKEVRDRGISGRTSVYNWLDIITKASLAKHLGEGVEVVPGGYRGQMAPVFRGRSRVLTKGRQKRPDHLIQTYRRILAMLDQVKAEDPENIWQLSELRDGRAQIERDLRSEGIDPAALVARWEFLPPPQMALPNPLLSVIGNPFTPGDAGLRARGREEQDLAASIDHERAMARRGEPPYERIYLRDALIRYGAGDYVDRAVVAKALKKLLKKRGIKVSVSTPRYARANSIGISGPKKSRLSDADQAAIEEILGVRGHQGTFDIVPNAREDQTDWATDYYRPGGPMLAWADAVELAEIVLGDLPSAKQWAPPLGFQVGQVVKFVGKRSKKRYLVIGVYQYAEDQPRTYSLQALSGGPRGSRPSGVPETDIELDADQETGVDSDWIAARQAEPVGWRQVSVGTLPDGRTVVHSHYKRLEEVQNALTSMRPAPVGMTGVGGSSFHSAVTTLPEGFDPSQVVAALSEAGFEFAAVPRSVESPRGVWLENPGGCPCYNARTGEVRSFPGGPAEATQRAAYEENPHRPVPTVPILNHVRTGDWCARTGREANPRDRKGEKLALWWSRMLDTITVALTDHPLQQGGMGTASMTRAQWLDRFARGKSKGAQDKMWSDLQKWIRQQEAKGYAIRSTQRPGWLDLNINNTYDAAWLDNEGTHHERGLGRERELLAEHYSGYDLAGRLADREDYWADLVYDEEESDPEISEEDYRLALEGERQSRLAAGVGAGSFEGRESNPHERTWERPREQDYDIDEFSDHPGFSEAMEDLNEFHGSDYEPDRVTVYEIDDGSDEETWAPMHSYLHELEDLTYTVPDKRSNKHQGAHPEDYPSSLRGEPGLWVHKFRGEVGAGRRAKLARPIVAKAGGAQALQIIPRGGGVADWYHS
jgi:hypothetical protein